MKKRSIFCMLGIIGWLMAGCATTVPYNSQPANSTQPQTSHVDTGESVPNTPLALHATIKNSADAIIEAYLSQQYEQSKYEFETLIRTMDPLPLDSRAAKINHLDRYYPPIDQSLTFAIIDDDLRWRNVQPVKPVELPPPAAAADWEKAEMPDKLFADNPSGADRASLVIPGSKSGFYFEKGLHKFIQQEIREVAIHMGEPENFKLPDDFVKEIEYYIRRFQNEPYYRKFFTETLSRSRKYIPALRDIFLEKGFPEEIMYLAFIESGFNPVAYSRSHAAGLFQFIKSTGTQYGLKINRSVDERYSPYKSAVACREYMHDLLLELGSFTMALSSYNSGAGKTRQALRKLDSFRDRSFWALREKTNVLKHETREYIPQIFAVIVMAKPGNPLQFGFDDVPFPRNYDTVIVPSQVNLESVARNAGINLRELLALNPDLAENATQTPRRVLDYPLFVPRGTKNAVDNAVSRQASSKISYSGSNGSSGSSGSQTYHRVQKGESLWLIARKYRVTVNQLKQWNGLSGNTISYGKKLVVYPGSTGATAASPQRTERAAAKTPQSAVSGSNVLVQQNISRGESFNYAVTAGNNLGEIAGVFGVSVSQLKSWNNLRSNTIRVGQRLRIVAQTGIRYYQYRVQSGDTVSEIASRFNARDSIIRFANGKSNNLVTVGEVLKIFSF